MSQDETHEYLLEMELVEDAIQKVTQEAQTDPWPMTNLKPMSQDEIHQCLLEMEMVEDAEYKVTQEVPETFGDTFSNCDQLETYVTGRSRWIPSGNGAGPQSDPRSPYKFIKCDQTEAEAYVTKQKTWVPVEFNDPLCKDQA